MRAGIFFTGTGPVMLLTSYETLTHPLLVEKLAAKGIKKYIAYEVPVDAVKGKYGHHFSVIMGDLHQQDDLRIMDYDGHHVFNLFSLKELGPPVVHEP